MYYNPTHIYGVNVQLTKLRIEGLLQDRTAEPGADITCFVRFNPVEAGCNPPTVICDPGSEDCTCHPGAQIAWYVNGTYQREDPWVGYSDGGIGYGASFRVIAPQSGTTIVTAQSANTVDFVFETFPTNQNAGTVAITNVYCGNSPHNNASCDGSNLIIYFYRIPVTTGNGNAYVDIYIDGVLKVENVQTSSSSAGYDSHTITCPVRNYPQTILVRGKNDGGASVVLPAGGDPCLTDNCGAGCPDEYRCGVCGNICNECESNPCSEGCPDYYNCNTCPNGYHCQLCLNDHCAFGCPDHNTCGICNNPPCGTCVEPPCGIGCPDYGKPTCGKNSIIDQIIAFINEQPMVALAGAGVLAYLLVKK